MALSVNIRSRTSRTKNGQTTFTVGQTTGRSKHYVEQHDIEQQPPHQNFREIEESKSEPSFIYSPWWLSLPLLHTYNKNWLSTPS
jgi:hypothetical protein